MKEKARLFYIAGLSKTKKEITSKEIKGKKNGYFRLVLFLLIIACCFLLSKNIYIYVSILSGLFLGVVVSDFANKKQLNYHKTLSKLYSFELNQNPQEKNLFDNGSIYKDPNH